MTKASGLLVLNCPHFSLSLVRLITEWSKSHRTRIGGLEFVVAKSQVTRSFAKVDSLLARILDPGLDSLLLTGDSARDSHSFVNMATEIDIIMFSYP